MQAVHSIGIFEGQAKLVWTNRIIQIGYDFIVSGDKSLEVDLETEMKEQNIPLSEKQAILDKIKSDFNL